jgi:quercetin dioxygenase-like cupin family protein
MAMKPSQWVKLFAAILFAGVIIFAALKVAQATPPRGVTPTLLAGPVELDKFNTGGETDDWELEIKSKGVTDAYVFHQKIAPGGFSGWHSHPGPVFVLVTRGTATLYDADDQTVTNYPAGTGFVEAQNNHNVVNEGDTDLELIAFFFVPKDAPRRIEEPAPGQ